MMGEEKRQTEIYWDDLKKIKSSKMIIFVEIFLQFLVSGLVLSMESLNLFPIALGMS